MTTADTVKSLIESLIWGFPTLFVWCWALWRALHAPANLNRWQRWIGSAVIVMIVFSMLTPIVFTGMIQWIASAKDPSALYAALGLIRLVSSTIHALCWLVVLNAAFANPGPVATRDVQTPFGSEF